MKKLIKLSLLSVMIISIVCSCQQPAPNAEAPDEDFPEVSDFTEAPENVFETFEEEPIENNNYEAPVEIKRVKNDKPIDYSVMPDPFRYTMYEEELMRFKSPTFNTISGNGGLDTISGSIITPFVDNETFLAWAEPLQASTFENKTKTDLVSNPNIYSYMKFFDIPADKVMEIMKNDNRALIEAGASEIWLYTDEEIELICSMDEVKIMEYFVSDYTVYHDGKVYTPQWFYWNDIKAYEEAGLTPTLLKEKLEAYNDFVFYEEAALAFEAKISDYIGEEFMFDKVFVPIETENESLY